MYLQRDRLSLSLSLHTFCTLLSSNSGKPFVFVHSSQTDSSRTPNLHSSNVSLFKSTFEIFIYLCKQKANQFFFSSWQQLMDIWKCLRCSFQSHPRTTKDKKTRFGNEIDDLLAHKNEHFW